MVMPIISMNRMAMNESVATTCCYKMTISGTNMYWETLNGGQIGPGYSAGSLGWKQPDTYYKKWALLPYDVDVEKLEKAGFPELEATSAGSNTTYSVNGVEISEFLRSIDGKKEDCEHNSSDCAYRISGLLWSSNLHFDSTTKHDTGGSAAHAAVQFSS